MYRSSPLFTLGLHTALKLFFDGSEIQRAPQWRFSLGCGRGPPAASPCTRRVLACQGEPLLAVQSFQFSGQSTKSGNQDGVDNVRESQVNYRGMQLLFYYSREERMKRWLPPAAAPSMNTLGGFYMGLSRLHVARCREQGLEGRGWAGGGWGGKGQKRHYERGR